MKQQRRRLHSHALTATKTILKDNRAQGRNEKTKQTKLAI